MKQFDRLASKKFMRDLAVLCHHRERSLRKTIRTVTITCVTCCILLPALAFMVATSAPLGKGLAQLPQSQGSEKQYLEFVGDFVCDSQDALAQILSNAVSERIVNKLPIGCTRVSGIVYVLSAQKSTSVLTDNLKVSIVKFEPDLKNTEVSMSAGIKYTMRLRVTKSKGKGRLHAQLDLEA